MCGSEDGVQLVQETADSYQLLTAPACVPIRLPVEKNNAVFICNEFVSAAATSAFQLEHMLWLLHTVYAPGAIKYGLSNMGKY